MQNQNSFDFKTILIDSSRTVIEIVVEYVLNNPQHFKELMLYALADEKKISLRAAWAAEMCADKKPELIEEYLDEIIRNINKFKTDGVRRCLLKFFINHFHRLNEEQTGILVDNCFKLFRSPFETIAIKHYSSQILYNISNKEPALKIELIAVLEEQVQKNNNSFGRSGKRMLGKLYAETSG